MLNTKPQGKEMVTFLLHLFVVPYMGKTKQWDIMIKTKEVENLMIMIEATMHIAIP
jgi:hypothetical protein